MIDVRVTGLHVRVYDPIATREARTAARPVVVDLTRQVLNLATVLCPVDTGYLRAQHSMSVTETTTTVRGDLANHASYAAAVHDGSRPHTITARRGTALRFVTPGGVVYARSVRHPGSPGRPWMTRAAEVVAATSGAHFDR